MNGVDCDYPDDSEEENTDCSSGAPDVGHEGSPSTMTPTNPTRHGRGDDHRTKQATEYQVVVLLPLGSEESCKPFEIIVYVRKMPRVPETAQVEILRGHRNNPTVKDSQWVSDRSYLESRKLPETDEVIMAEGDGSLTEGMTSNFFVVKDGMVFTAPDDTVLNGTMRSSVIKCCERRNIPFALRAPKVDEAESWDGCFITSTSRIVMPVRRLKIDEEISSTFLPALPTWFTFNHEPESIVAKIQDWVLEEIGTPSSGTS